MNETKETSELKANIDNLPTEQKELFEKTFTEIDNQFVSTVQLEKLEKNDVIVFRINKDNLNLIMSLPILCEKYKDVFTPKNISILIMGPDEKIEILNEKEMNRLGWIKQGLIVYP